MKTSEEVQTKIKEINNTIKEIENLLNGKGYISEVDEISYVSNLNSLDSERNALKWVLGG